MKLIKLVLGLLLSVWFVFAIAASALGAAEIVGHLTKSRPMQFAMIAWSLAVALGGVMATIGWIRRSVLRTTQALVLPGMALVPFVFVMLVATLVTRMIP